MKHICYSICDYEHEGDLRAEEDLVREQCPEVENIRTWQERDYEAESEYRSEYGECDESIYRGYIEFDVPEKFAHLFDNH